MKNLFGRMMALMLAAMMCVCTVPAMADEIYDEAANGAYTEGTVYAEGSETTDYADAMLSAAGADESNEYDSILPGVVEYPEATAADETASVPGMNEQINEGSDEVSTPGTDPAVKADVTKGEELTDVPGEETENNNTDDGNDVSAVADAEIIDGGNSTGTGSSSDEDPQNNGQNDLTDTGTEDSGQNESQPSRAGNADAGKQEDNTGINYESGDETSYTSNEAGNAANGASSENDEAGYANDGAGNTEDEAGYANDGAGNAEDGAGYANDETDGEKDGANGVNNGTGDINTEEPSQNPETQIPDSGEQPRNPDEHPQDPDEQPQNDPALPEETVTEDETPEGESTQESGEGLTVSAGELNIPVIPDFSADIEDYTFWDTMFSSIVLTGNWAEDLITIAQIQKGYKESTLNYITDAGNAVENAENADELAEYADGYAENANEHKGYTRYRAWYGYPYEDWSAMFVAFCLYYAGIPESSMPVEKDVQQWIETLSWQDMYVAAGSPYGEDVEDDQPYEPKPGDLIFIADDYMTAESVGIITQINKETGEIIVIAGDVKDDFAEDAVREVTYYANDWHILGYGVLPENPAVLPAAALQTNAEAVMQDLPGQEETEGSGNVLNQIGPNNQEEAENNILEVNNDEIAAGEAASGVSESTASGTAEEIPEKTAIETPEEIIVQENPENVAGDTPEETSSEAAEETLPKTILSEEGEVAVAANDPALGVILSGTCGDHLTWTLDAEGVLTISGTGRMADYNFIHMQDNLSPWCLNSNINKVIIEEGVTSIGDNAFPRCESMLDIKMPDSLESIGENAFFECRSLLCINVPEDMDNEDGWAFIPNGVTEIEPWAFTGCNSLKNVVLPDTITSISSHTFFSCKSLTYIYIPDSVTIIEDNAFKDCESLPSINIPDSVTEIGNLIFCGCSNLADVFIPNSVKRIGFGAFSECSNLKIVYYSGTEDEWNQIIWDTSSFGETGSEEELANAIINFNSGTIIIDETYRAKLNETISVSAVYRGQEGPGDCYWTCADKQHIKLSVDSILGPFDGEKGKEWYISATVRGNKAGEYDIVVKSDNSKEAAGKLIIGPKFPDGYEFENDSYNFENYIADITLENCQALFEDGPALAVYLKSGGSSFVCYGMASTTASLFYNNPAINGRIRDLSKSDLINAGAAGNISIDTFIKDAYFYQRSQDNLLHLVNGKCPDIFTLYDTVSRSIDNNQLVLVNFYSGIGDHEVLAVGYDGKDILIDDPNNKDELEKIVISQDGSWYFTGTIDGNTYDNQTTTMLACTTDYLEPYRILSTGTKVGSRDTLFYTDSSTEVQLPPGSIEIPQGDVAGINSGTMYWVDNSDSVSLGNIAGEDNNFWIAGDDTFISIECGAVGSLSSTINSGEQSLHIDTDEGRNVTIGFETVNDNSRVTALISGDTTGTEVKLKAVSDGLYAEGIRNGTVTILKNDEQVAVYDIPGSGDGYIINYDNTGEGGSTSVVFASGEFKKVDNKWKYYINNKFQSSMTGMVKGTINGKTAWYYIKKGVYTKATGITKKADGSSSKWYFVKNGKYTKATGIAQRADKSNKKWYFVKKGVYTKATGIAQKADGSSKKWYFVKKGVYTKATGIAKKAGSSSNKWYFVRKGIYTKATGIAKKADGSSKTWFYVKNGVYKKATTVARKAGSSSKTKYYVKAGKLKKYTGTVKIGSKKYKVVKGVVKKVLK